MNEPYQLTFDDYAAKVLFPLEKKGSVCSFCGASLPSDYYLILSAWRSETRELVAPQSRMCRKCARRLLEEIKDGMSVARE
jgi:hypothetical protein